MPALLSRVAGAGGLLVLVLGLTAAQSGHLSGRPAQAGAAATPAAVDPGIRNYLYGVAALSASDAWAAGYYCTGHCGGPAETDRTLIAHWDGTTWAQVPSPSPGTTVSRLSSVSADSATDVWAAGNWRWCCPEAMLSAPAIEWLRALTNLTSPIRPAVPGFSPGK